MLSKFNFNHVLFGCNANPSLSCFVLCTGYFGAAMVIYDVVARMRRETIKFVYFFGLFTRNLASKIKFSNLTERREF